MLVQNNLTMSKKRKSKIDRNKIQAIRDGALWSIIRQFTQTELHPLLQEIRNRKQDDRIRNVLMNYLLIRTVTVFENFMLNLAVRYIHKHKDVAKELLIDPKLDDTIGEQLASTRSFINLDDIGLVFSTFLKKDFFSEIKNESIRHAPDYQYEFEHITYASPLHKNWNKFENIFELRHQIVHHNKLTTLGWKEYRDMIESVLDFMMCSIMIVVPPSSKGEILSTTYKRTA